MPKHKSAPAAQTTPQTAAAADASDPSDAPASAAVSGAGRPTSSSVQAGVPPPSATQTQTPTTTMNRHALDPNMYPLSREKTPAEMSVSFPHVVPGACRRTVEMPGAPLFPESSTYASATLVPPSTTTTTSSSSSAPANTIIPRKRNSSTLVGPSSKSSSPSGFQTSSAVSSKPLLPATAAETAAVNAATATTTATPSNSSTSSNPHKIRRIEPVSESHPIHSTSILRNTTTTSSQLPHEKLHPVFPPVASASSSSATFLLASSSTLDPSSAASSPVPVSNPTGPLETPLSPANSPRTDTEDEDLNRGAGIAGRSSSSSNLDHRNTDGSQMASSQTSTAHTSLTKSTVNSFLVKNLTSPSHIPRSLNLHPTLDDAHTVIDTFGNMSPQLKRNVLFKMLQACDRKTLSIMSGIIMSALRHDILSALPMELIPKILGYLDVKSLCAACQVSKSWRSIIDASEITWKVLLARDEYHYTPVEFARAQNEHWDYLTWGRKPGEDKPSSNFPDPLPSLAQPINIYKAIYRRKHLINRNWLDPNSRPYHLSMPGNPQDMITCLQFDDDKIVIGSDDYTITIYDTNTGVKRTQFTGHTGGVWALQYVNNTLVSGSTDRTVRVWDMKRQVCTHRFSGHVSTVRCLDIILPVQIGTDKHGNPIMAPKHPLIVTGSRDHNLRVWRLPPEGSDPPDFVTEDNGGRYFMHVLSGHTDSVRAISGYGNLVVSGSYDTTVRVWEVESGSCRWVLEGHAQRVYSAVIDPKRNRCISGSMDWLVKVWSLETGSLLYTLQGHTSLVGLVDLNRTTIVSAAADATLRVWNPEDGSFLHKLEGHRGAIISFQHDEYKVVSGSEEDLKLWNIRTGTLVRDLLQGMQRIWQVRFDSRRCVAVVIHNGRTSVEVLDFDYDPYTKDDRPYTVRVVTSDDTQEQDHGHEQQQHALVGNEGFVANNIANNNHANFGDAIAHAPVAADAAAAAPAVAPAAPAAVPPLAAEHTTVQQTHPDTHVVNTHTHATWTNQASRIERATRAPQHVHRAMAAAAVANEATGGIATENVATHSQRGQRATTVAPAAPTVSHAVAATSVGSRHLPMATNGRMMMPRAAMDAMMERATRENSAAVRQRAAAMEQIFPEFAATASTSSSSSSINTTAGLSNIGGAPGTSGSTSARQGLQLYIPNGNGTDSLSSMNEYSQSMRPNSSRASRSLASAPSVSSSHDGDNEDADIGDDDPEDEDEEDEDEGNNQVDFPAAVF